MLIPIRVDAISGSPNLLRIVDTFLVDLNVLPGDTLRESAILFAERILLDAEVSSMSRTVRHFTGRLDLWQEKIVHRMAAQIHDQLLFALDAPPIQPRSEPPLEPQLTSSTTIPIQLRMSLHGVRIHDDFYYDPSIGTPLELAASVAQDLQLAPDFVPPIALEIAEQIRGRKVIAEKKDPGGPSNLQNATAAWTLDSKEHVTNVAFLVAQQKPK